MSLFGQDSAHTTDLRVLAAAADGGVAALVWPRGRGAQEEARLPSGKF